MTYNSYIEAASTRYIIDYLDISIQQNAKRGLQVLNNSEIRSVKANIIDSSILMRSCNDCVLTNVVQSGSNKPFHPAVSIQDNEESWEQRTTTGPRYRDWETDRKSTRLNSSHITRSRMPSSA